MTRLGFVVAVASCFLNMAILNQGIPASGGQAVRRNQGANGYPDQAGVCRLDGERGPSKGPSALIWD